MTFGATVRGGDRVVHRLGRITNESHGGPRVSWLCGSAANHAELFDAPPQNLRPCRRCGLGIGGVYFAERDGLIKIGWSATPTRRALSLGASLLAVHEGDMRTERTLHRVFADDREHGEWFRRSPALLTYIERTKHAAPAGALLITAGLTEAEQADWYAAVAELEAEVEHLEAPVVHTGAR